MQPNTRLLPIATVLTLAALCLMIAVISFRTVNMAAAEAGEQKLAADHFISLSGLLEHVSRHQQAVLLMLADAGEMQPAIREIDRQASDELLRLKALPEFPLPGIARQVNRDISLRWEKIVLLTSGDDTPPAMREISVEYKRLFSALEQRLSGLPYYMGEGGTVIRDLSGLGQELLAIEQAEAQFILPIAMQLAANPAQQQRGRVVSARTQIVPLNQLPEIHQQARREYMRTLDRIVEGGVPPLAQFIKQAATLRAVVGERLSADALILRSESALHQRLMWRQFILLGLLFCCTGIVMWIAWQLFANRQLHTIGQLTSSLRQMATGSNRRAIPFTQHNTPLGELAREVEDLQAANLRQQQQKYLSHIETVQKEERQQRLEKMIRSFETRVANELNSLVTMADELVSSTESLALEMLSASQGNGDSANHAGLQRLVHRARVQLDGVQENIQSFLHDSERLGQKVGEFNGLATRLNLAAINATIEAGRAGDSGKEFATLADEIKQLSGKAAQIAGGVMEQLGQMQEDSRGINASNQRLQKTFASLRQPIALEVQNDEGELIEKKKPSKGKKSGNGKMATLLEEEAKSELQATLITTHAEIILQRTQRFTEQWQALNRDMERINEEIEAA